MKYETLLFDADGTLLDFRKSEMIGLANVFETFQIPDQERCRQYYLALNETLWKGFEAGQYPKQHIFDVRFQMMLDHFHIDGDGQAMEAEYRKWLNRGSHLMPHALEVVSQLAQTHTLYIVTNGVSQTQYQRLKDSGLYPYFQDIFVSEDIGFQKPQTAYFDYVFAHIQKDKKQILLIGDSLHSDILGANQAQIASCWYHPHQKENDTNITYTYDITSLVELNQIVR